jgi:hypothetical protein
MDKELDLEECIYHEIINRPGLLKRVEKDQLSGEKGGLAECYACGGFDVECPDYKSLKEEYGK